jgi:Zn finger protein HypA/HybF involved in hydrogenase expression
MSSFDINGLSIRFITCSECGVYFGFPQHSVDAKQNNGGTFWCPNGHSQAWQVTTVEKQRRQIEKLQQNEARLMQERQAEIDKRFAAEKRELALKRRIGKGTCPCCKRTFTNVQRHMAHKHPEIATLKRTA